jgi:Tol biopolymer transport system component
MSRKSKQTSLPFYWIIVLTLLSLSLVVVPIISANDETPTPEPTTESTTVPTEIATEITVTATEPLSTLVPPTETVTVEPTTVVAPTSQPTNSGMSLQSMQTSCRLLIDDLADNNPFTYAFSTSNANNIASYSWNFGDSGTANTASATHTYATTGTFTITLVCTPTAGYGSPITLTGSITVSSTPVANFTITPSTMMTGLPPFNVATVNNSTGGGLTYSWKISTSSNPADAGIYSATTQNISYSFPSYGVYWFHLTVTDGAGVMAGASQSVTFNAPQPQAQFTLTPADGTSPLNVTVQGTDMGAGPITSWSWDFGDGSPVVTGQGPHNHTYTLADPAIAQSFFITLTYSGPGGSGTYTREVGVYPPAEPVFANFTAQSMGNVGGGVQYCFTNTSIGPVATSRWDFDGNGTYDLTSNDAIVCHVYTIENTFTVRLQVQNAAATSTSTASNAVSVFFSPVANFTVTPGMTITWGSTVNFDSSSSTGTILTYSWDFNGDGIEDSATPNPSGISLTTLGNNTIRLTVTGPGGTSYVEKIVFVARATISCDFSGSLSVLPSAGAQAYTSNITNLLGRTVSNYAWTVTGMGAGLPLSFNTPNISVDWSAFGTGAFVVTLEATASDGASCSETKTVTRAWLPLNCQMTDTLPPTVYSNGTNYTFTANVSNLDGRTINYTWYVDGALQSNNSDTFDRSWTGNPAVAYNEVVRYEVIVDNGDSTFSNCFEETTVTIRPYPTLACSMISTLPGTLYPNGSTYNFSTNVNNLAGRPIIDYRWYLDGVLQTSTINNYDWTNITDSTLTPVSYNVRYEVTVDNGGGATVDCIAQVTFTVNNWPALSCAGGITGNVNPIPALPDNMTRSYTYTANVSGVAGRTIVYNWTVGSGTLISQTGNQATIRWDAADSSAAPGTPDSFSVSVTVTNPDGTTVNTNCGSTANVMVQVPRLTCAAPIGDLTPVNGETNTYTTSITNQFGRTLGAVNWTLEIFNTGTSAWDFVTGSTGATFNYSIFTPGEQYRLSYATTVSNPSDNCVSAYQTLTVTGSGVNFQCDAFPTAGNNFAPTSAAASYTYSVDMDNGNLIPLHYDWILVGPGTTERLIGTSTSSGDGIVAGAALSGAAMGPVGNYTLRVDVRAVNNTDNSQPDYSNYACSLAHAVVVGTLNVNYNYTAFGGGALNASAVAVGQQICFTNTSDTTHLPTEINRLTYVWNIGGVAANNNFNTNAVSAEQLSSCMIFSQAGSYTVNLVGTNDYQGDASFMRTANHSVTFTVYGLQSIAINRSSQVFAPATINFDAVGVNITSGYTWTFYRIGNPTPLGTATGQNVSRFFGTPGDYRAVVSGSGPLGTTTGQVDFTLLNASQIRAAFTPSQYGGVAPMHVCFTDQSVGSPITTWSWDFGNGQPLLNYTSTTVPSQICTDYTTPSTSYTVTLTISNGSVNETATNVVRTYSLLESSASFSITPNGSAQYCFTANISGSTAVTGWDFGDSNTGAAQNNICHTYAASGSYVVHMNIVNTTTGETGSVVRVVNVNLSGGAAPSLSVVGNCSPQRTATFTVSNGGGDMTTPDQVVIRDNSGTIILMESFTLTAGTSRDFIVTNQSGTVSLTTTDSALTASTNCEYPPAVTLVVICSNGLPMFTLTNNDGPMITTQTYEIRNSANTVVANGSFQLARGAAPVTFTVPANSNPYDTYTFISGGEAGTFNMSRRCAPAPSLIAARVCLTGTQFVITNTGSDMVRPQTFMVVNTLHNTVVTPADNSFQLVSGASLLVYLDGADPMADYTLTSSGLAGNLNVSGACDHLDDGNSLQSVSSASSDATTPTPLGGGIDGVSFPDWASVPTCGYSCPTFRLYHTDETGDWEIFRLDGANQEAQESFRRNLSLGEGEGVNDMAPSLSPNDEYIVFTSNRATEPGQPENWEIYVASTSGDASSVQRVTYNAFATDTDPVWGPNNFIVYETTRNGNWDLYMVDMGTGQEYQLTDSAADDINPYWSPDGSKLVFQSDRDGNGWQIFELDLLSRSIKRLSDGTSIDVDPQYSDDGSQLLYRSYTDSEDNSVITVMNTDGTNAHAITTPEENATNGVWSPSGRFIAYQSDLDGDLDIYVTEVATGALRKLTDNDIADYAPTWLCGDDRVMFTSEIMNEPDIFEQDVLPLDAPAVHVEEESDQMTFIDANDIYPSNSPSEENASREGRTVLGSFGEQTSFLHPAVDVTEVNLSIDGAEREDWRTLNTCSFPS